MGFEWRTNPFSVLLVDDDSCVCQGLMLNLNRHIRYTLTRFRFGVSDIKVHRSRFKVYNADELKCPLCLSAVDNEVHFVLCCPAFDDLRYEFIEPKYFNNPCDFRLALLLATQNERALKNLALFVYKAFNRRKTLLLCRTWKDMIYIYIRMRWTNNHGQYCNIFLYIAFRFGLFIWNIPTSANWILCVHCITMFIVLTPLQMGLWPCWIKYPYSVFSLSLQNLNELIRKTTQNAGTPSSSSSLLLYVHRDRKDC